MRHLYSIGNEARTVFNRMGIVEQLLRLHGITGLLKRGDKPKYVANVREMYQPEDLQALFKACDPDEKVLYMFFLLTGERDKEVRHTSWDDIDFTRKCVRVTAKKHLGFKPKDKEEREIPVPSQLLTALKESCTDKIVGLTGTLLGGYADDLFNTLFRLEPAKMKQRGYEFGSAGPSAFAQDYGVLETITKIEPAENACSKAKATTMVRRKPVLHRCCSASF